MTFEYFQKYSIALWNQTLHLLHKFPNSPPILGAYLKTE